MRKFFDALLLHPGFWILQVIVAIGYIVSAHGIGLTHDSAMYVFSARDIFANGTLTDPSGNAMVLYPPLYSWLLALGLYGHIPVQLWAIILNVTAHCTIVLLVRTEALKLRHPALQYGLLLSVVYGMPLLQNSVFLWADAPFVAFYMLAGYFLLQYLERDKKYYFALAAVFTVLGIYERYIGVACVAACCLHLLIFSKRKIHLRFVEAFLFGAFCSAFFMLWEYRNYLSAGTTNHPYDPGIFSFAQNISDTFRILGSYWIPSNLPAVAAFLTALFFFGYLSWKVLFFIQQKKFISDMQRESMWIFSLIFYLLFFILLNTVFYICDWDDRYLSLCYPFAMLIFFKGCDEYLPRFLSAKLITVVVLLTLSYTLARYFKNAWQWKSHGIGFNSRLWQENTVLCWVKSQEHERLYISNNSMPIIIPGNKTCYYFPLALQKPAIAVMWSDEFKLNYVEWTLKDLEVHYRIENGPEFAEGKVYYLFPKK